MTAYDALHELYEHFGIRSRSNDGWAHQIIAIIGAPAYFREVAPLVAALHTTYRRRGIDPLQVEDVDKAAELTGTEVERFLAQMALIRKLNAKTSEPVT